MSQVGTDLSKLFYICNFKFKLEFLREFLRQKQSTGKRTACILCGKYFTKNGFNVRTKKEGVAVDNGDYICDMF